MSDINGIKHAFIDEERYLETISFAARIGNRILNLLVSMFVVVAISYSSYALWDTYNVYRGAFLNDDLLKYKPSGGVGESNPTLEELMLINKDVLGWIQVDDTHIDYPFVVGKDDMEYVNKDIYGNFSLSGAIFLTMANAHDLSDRYNLMYGHHMDNGGMFGDVMEFIDKKYFDKRKTGILYTPDTTYNIEIWACIETDAYDDEVYNVLTKKTEDDMAHFISYVEKNATNIRDDLNIQPSDKLIALSTCVDAATNGRALVIGRLTK